MSKRISHHFDPEEEIVIFEAARVALADAEMFDRLAEELDLTDDEMVELREKLQSVMDEEHA